jgi:hypothetical protein
MKKVGIMLNPETNDFDIRMIKHSDGKIVQGIYIGDVTKQNTNIILKIEPGELKLAPTVGVGIDKILLDHDYLLYKHRIRQQLDTEGMQVNHLEIKGQNIEINANYK